MRDKIIQVIQRRAQEYYSAPFSVFTKNEINGIIGAGEKCSVYYLKFT